MEKEKGIVIEVDSDSKGDSTSTQISLENLSVAIGSFTASVNSIYSNIRENILQTMKNFVEAIDFSRLSDVQQLHIKNIMIMLQQGWKEGWYLCDDLMMALLDNYGSLTEEYEFEEEYLKSCFQKNFDSITNKVINHIYYDNHKEVLLESKRLFVEKRFAISAYPLFSAMDNIFTRWLFNPEQIEVDKNTNFISWKEKNELRNNKEDFNPYQTLDISHLTIYSAYEGFLFYFSKCDNREILNRNIYMHGNYNYSKMDEIKCLQLWSFLALCIDCIEELQNLKKDELKVICDL